MLARAQGPLLRDVPDSVRLIDLHSPRVVIGLPALVRYLRRERPEVLFGIISNAALAAVLAVRLAGGRTLAIVSEHTMISSIVCSTRRLRHRMIVPSARWLYPRADGLVAVSEAVAEDIARTTGVERERIRVIPNAVLRPELRTLALRSVAHPWFAPGQPPVLLGVGSLSASKDFSTLIRAFAELRRRHRARLLILGEGEERRRLEDLIRRLDLQADVQLAGFVANPFAYMAKSAMLVLSSVREGLPSVLIEALALGTPVVATDCPSGPRELLGDGRYGALVAPGDVRGLAEQMGQVLVRPLPVAPASFGRNYSPDVVVERYIDLLHRVRVAHGPVPGRTADHEHTRGEEGAAGLTARAG